VALRPAVGRASNRVRTAKSLSPDLNVGPSAGAWSTGMGAALQPRVAAWSWGRATSRVEACRTASSSSRRRLHRVDWRSSVSASRRAEQVRMTLRSGASCPPGLDCARPRRDEHVVRATPAARAADQQLVHAPIGCGRAGRRIWGCRSAGNTRRAVEGLAGAFVWRSRTPVARSSAFSVGLDRLRVRISPMSRTSDPRADARAARREGPDVRADSRAG